MCRYALTHYKKHYACFACRKSFKRRNKEDVDPMGDDHPARCPQCNLLMADMGLDFKPPKTSDERAWEAAAALFEVGETFHSCGCGGPGYRPRDPSKLAAFFAKRRAQYVRQRDQWLTTKPDSAKLAKNREEAIKSWQARIDRIDHVLQHTLRR